MVARNPITGDALISRKTGDSYREGWDRIFKNKQSPKEENETICDQEQSGAVPTQDEQQSPVG